MSTGSAHTGVRVRAIAAGIDAQIVDQGQSMTTALASAPSLPPRDAALVRALVFGACRWHHRLNWQISRLLSQPGKRLPPQVGALLRIGLFQLQETRVPNHAAVAATVSAAPMLRVPRAKGLINAVLRRFLREREQLEAQQAEVPVARFSCPAWLIERVQSDWPDAWRSVLDAGNALPPMWLRVNLARTSRDAYRARLGAAGIDAVPGAGSPAALLLAEPRPQEMLPGYAEGFVSVQDAAAQLAAGLLGAQPGDRVLDACAAPGGKSASILEMCPEGIDLHALDRDASRLDHMRSDFSRLGLKATFAVADSARVESWWDGRPFDRVLLDPPCSALGVIRRHPDIKVLRAPADLGRCAADQAELLDALWPLLAPGGRLVYATCTLSASENRVQIEQFIARHPDVEHASGPRVRHREIASGQENMDGFYYASLHKMHSGLTGAP